MPTFWVYGYWERKAASKEVMRKKEMIGRSGAAVQSTRAILVWRWELRPHNFGPRQERPLKPGKLGNTPITLTKSIFHELNMITSENHLISPSGKSWIRQLANIIHISRKIMSQQDKEERPKESWEAELGTASPIAIDWRHTEPPAWLSAWQYLQVQPFTFKHHSLQASFQFNTLQATLDYNCTCFPSALLRLMQDLQRKGESRSKSFERLSRKSKHQVWWS